MILNHQFVINKIINFIVNYTKTATTKSFAMNFDNSIESALVLYLCEQARKQCGYNIFAFGTDPGCFEFAEFSSKELDLSNPPNNSLIVSNFHRTNGIIERKFHKYKDAADIYPILDLYYSEVIDLVNYIYPDHKFNIGYCNHELLEWVDRDNIKTNIIYNEESPLKNKLWYKYTIPQKDMIAKLHQREKVTRHKQIIGKPFAEIRIMKEVR